MVFELRLRSQHFVMLHWRQFGVKNSFRSTRSATGKASLTLITLGRPHAIFLGLSSFFPSSRKSFSHINILLFCCLTHVATRVSSKHSFSCYTENGFRPIIFYEFVILARPESIPASESTPWVRVGVGVGVTQKFIDSAALIVVLSSYLSLGQPLRL